MTEPIPVDAARLFEFIGGPELKVLFVSLHPVHAFNRVLNQKLGTDHESLSRGTVSLADLVTTGGPAVRFLHEGLRRCGAPNAFGVLPGYYLFRGTEMIAWDSGLPSLTDVQAVARSALFGAIWSGVMRDIAFLEQSLQGIVDQTAGDRLASRFLHLAADPGAGRPSSDPGTRDDEDVFWAYRTLGVLPTATDREVHEAWRRRRRENHPDLAAGDPGEFARRSRVSADVNRARDMILEYRSGGARRAS